MVPTRATSIRACLTIAAAVALVSCGDSGDEGTTAATETTTVTRTETGSAAANQGEGAGGGKKTGSKRGGSRAKRVSGPLAAPRNAIRLAERRAGGDAYDIERDRLGGKRVWEIKLTRRSGPRLELDVSADGRRVRRQRRTGDDDDDAAAAAKARVSLGEALRRAGRRARGASLDEASFDRDDGRPLWEVSLDGSGGREIEAKVDARSGKVFDVERDDGNDGDDDDDDD